MTQKTRILTFLGFYLPGFKAGGPVRTIANMMEVLGDEFDFWIVTRDRDLGDDFPYANVTQNKWCEVGKARVFYCSPDRITISRFAKLISETPHDVLYLNSFFSPNFTIKPLLARYLGKLPEKAVIIAPRGEFSQGALRIKKLKKMLYIFIAKRFGLYNDITWQASSVHEKEDIIRSFKVKKSFVKIVIAIDLKAPPSTGKQDYQKTSSEKCNSTILRIIFLSRISPMKNLDFVLQILASVKTKVQFDIFGPIEDAGYWKRCKLRIDNMPENIQIAYCGSVMPDQVERTFAKYDLFFFPTRGENYGHVIAESLSVGTPVLLSDQTPWRDLKIDRLGWDLKLEDIEGFSCIIEHYSQMTQDAKNNLRDHIKQIMARRLNDPVALETNRHLFLYAIKD